MSQTFVNFQGIVRLTRNPEMVSAARKPLANVGIVSNHKYRREDGTTVEEPPLFLDGEAYGGTARTLVEYTKKGDQVYLEGRLKMDVWIDQASKVKRSAVKIVIRRVVLLPQSSGLAAQHEEPASEGDDE